jgi:hypothetical protein
METKNADKKGYKLFGTDKLTEEVIAKYPSASMKATSYMVNKNFFAQKIMFHEIGEPIDSTMQTERMKMLDSTHESKNLDVDDLLEPVVDSVMTICAGDNRCKNILKCQVCSAVKSNPPDLASEIYLNDEIKSLKSRRNAVKISNRLFSRDEKSLQSRFASKVSYDRKLTVKSKNCCKSNRTPEHIPKKITSDHVEAKATDLIVSPLSRFSRASRIMPKRPSTTNNFNLYGIEFSFTTPEVQLLKTTLYAPSNKILEYCRYSNGIMVYFTIFIALLIDTLVFYIIYISLFSTSGFGAENCQSNSRKYLSNKYL